LPYGRRWGGWYVPLAETRFDLYVCPRTGLLKKVRRPKTVESPRVEVYGRNRIAVAESIRVNPGVVCVRVGRDWFHCSVRRVERDPRLKNTTETIDALLGSRPENSSPAELKAVYGADVVCVACHRMGKQERNQYPIPR
jgi:hypothetical protein